MNKNAAPKGIYIFAMLFIISSLMHMITLVSSKDWYFTLYSYLDAGTIELRYAFSWFQRILGLLAGIGLLFHKNIFRILSMVIAWFTITTIYWKHPIKAFEAHSQILDRSPVYQKALEELRAIVGGEYYIPSFSDLSIISSIIHGILDIIFCGALIYYFTRPQIIEFFKNSD